MSKQAGCEGLAGRDARSRRCHGRRNFRPGIHRFYLAIEPSNAVVAQSCSSPWIDEVLAFFRTHQWLILGGSGEPSPCRNQTA